MSKERPYVVNGEFTAAFHQDVAVAEANAAREAAKKPRCQVCGTAMWLGQPDVHHSCVRSMRP